MEASTQPFRSTGDKITKVRRSDIQVARNDKIANADHFAALVDEEDEEEKEKFEKIRRERSMEPSPAAAAES